MKSISRSLLVVYLLPVLLAAACAPASSPQGATTAEAQTAATDSGSVEIASADLTGASLYKFACAACHGQDHAGSTFEVAGQTIKVPALDWTDLNILYTADRSRGSIAEQVALAITKGQDGGGGEMNAMMPRWLTLSQAQIDSLIQYIQAVDTTEGTQPSPEPAGTNLTGEQTLYDFVRSLPRHGRRREDLREGWKHHPDPVAPLERTKQHVLQRPEPGQRTGTSGPGNHHRQGRDGRRTQHDDATLVVPFPGAGGGSGPIFADKVQVGHEPDRR